MRRATLLLATLLLVMAPAAAHAVITSRVILVLGVALTPAQAKHARDIEPELRKQGLVLLEDPSMTDGLAPKPTFTTYVGMVLATQVVGHNTPTAASHPPPTADEIAKLDKQLVADGLPGHPTLVAVVAYTGGK